MAAVQVDELTSGASGRIIPVFRNLRRSVLSYDSLRRCLIFIQSIFLWFLLILPRHRRSSPANPAPLPSSSPKRKYVVKREEEDTLRRRALAEGLEMVSETDDDWVNRPQWSTSLFFGVRCNALFCRTWFPATGETKGIIVIIHGLNEHSGRYAQFAKQLTSCNFGVYAMDWIGLIIFYTLIEICEKCFGALA